jgi:hypothetical protein
MKSFIITIILVSFVCIQVRTQEYKNAISGRIGLSSGFTYQRMVDDFRGYKGMLSFRDGGIQLTALLESYRPLYLKFTDKMYYYTGMGAHIGYTMHPPQRSFVANPFRSSYRYGNFAPVIGLDAIIGLEFRLDRAPLAFCLDAKPFFELFGQNIFRLSIFDIGFSMKYTF